MFLFGTRPAATASPPSEGSGVAAALRYGADRTGTDFNYLMRTAERESALDPNAKARTSSATGLFQFIEQTWLGVVKATGAKHGLAAEADAISDKGGRLVVPDPAMRERILQMRNDPKVSAVMAGELTQKNFSNLSSALGRPPTSGELYAAHFLGASGAASLSAKAQSNPTAKAAELFPDEASANRRIFHDRDGRARSVSEVYANLTASNAETAIIKVAADDAAQQGPSASAAWLGAFPKARGADSGKGPDSLFNSEVRTGPVSQTVARLWQTGRSAGRAEAGNGGFFPRSEASGGSSPTSADIDIGQSEPVSARVSILPEAAPLPPSRPSFEAAAARTGSGQVVPRVGRPLNLQTFMAGHIKS